MMRMPMPKPACAAAPNGRLTAYTSIRYTAMSANSAPAGRPIFSMSRQRSNRGSQSRNEKRRYASAGRKYTTIHTTPMAIATSVESAAPATPRAMPVPHPKISTGASTMLRMTVAVCTTMPGRKLPVPRSADPIATRPNCSASEGMNQSR